MVELKDMPLEELTGVIETYPWFAGAHLELCRRMWEMGAGSGETGQYATEALYIPDRGILSLMMREKADHKDRNIKIPVPAQPVQENRTVYVNVGGDYFSREQYESVKQGSDNVFSRMAGKIREERTQAESPSRSSGPEDFATETLARIYLEQDRPEQAKRIYSRLVLEFPEKSAYFAALIEKLEENKK